MKTTDSILRALAYFDIFSYPLRIDEIREFADTSLTIPEIGSGIGILIGEKKVFSTGAFYSLRNDISLAERRTKGNRKAIELLQIAYRVGSILHKFPFVKGVGISGSLSKDYADENADIDFFIITRSNRLWIARTLLHCLKKLSFLRGREDWYCMNYFIDEEALLIAERNIFTATEVVTLKPVHASSGIHDFFIANDWVNDYFPNRQLNITYTGDDEHRWYRKITEACLDTRFGNWLDNRLMNITAKRWHRKEQRHKLNSKGEPVGLSIDKHFARPNPGHLQKKILTMYHDKLQFLSV